MSKTHLNIGDSAPSVLLTDAEGQQRQLSSVWAEKPTLLTFLRHFG